MLGPDPEDAQAEQSDQAEFCRTVVEIQDHVDSNPKNTLTGIQAGCHRCQGKARFRLGWGRTSGALCETDLLGESHLLSTICCQ
jgi:hypothetical protein